MTASEAAHTAGVGWHQPAQLREGRCLLCFLGGPCVSPASLFRRGEPAPLPDAWERSDPDCLTIMPWESDDMMEEIGVDGTKSAPGVNSSRDTGKSRRHRVDGLDYVRSCDQNYIRRPNHPFISGHLDGSMQQSCLLKKGTRVTAATCREIWKGCLSCQRLVHLQGSLYIDRNGCHDA